MTKEEFAALQNDQQQSGMSLKTYLKQKGTSYSTYTYWRRKFQYDDEPHGIAPITFKPATVSAPSEQAHGGATVMFPNGVRVHFGSGMEHLLMELLNKSLGGHVLP